MSETLDEMRVLVVDDEHLERQAIPLILDQASATFKVVGEARNGNEALRLSVELKPDIILMDIKMPGMDGLTAAREIKKALPAVAIIFLTAYDEFDYAKEALRVGALDYLLKPLRSKDLLEILGKARNLLLEEKVKQEERKELQEQLAEALPWLKVNLGLGLVFGLWEERSAVEQQAGLLKLEVLPRVAFGVYMENRLHGDKALPAKLDLLRYQLQQIIDEALNNRPYGICLPISERVLVGLWGTREPEPEWHLRRLAEDIIKASSEKLTLGVTVGLGNFCENIGQLPRSVWEAQMAAHLGRFYLGPERVVSVVELGQYDYGGGYTYAGEKKIIDALRSGNQEEVCRLFREFLGSVSKGGNTDLYLVKARLMSMLAMFSRSPGLSQNRESKVDEENGYLEFARRMELCRSLEELEEWLAELAATVGQGERSRIPVNGSVKRVLSYIHENYQQELSLNDLSRVIFLSPDYFSRVFKEQVGYTFSEYILNLRVKKAQELLAYTDLPVGEIGRNVGYPDPNYFSRVFGRSTGLSPSRYRQEINGCPNSKRKSGACSPVLI